jgi:hypothetical protein
MIMMKKLLPGAIALVALTSLLTPLSAMAGLMINVGGEVITDNGPGDTNLTAGVIDFNVEDKPGYSVHGTLKEIIDPGISAKLILTDLSIESTAATASDTISFSSDPFPVIGPPSTATVHLDGQYGTSVAVPISNSLIRLDGFANGSLFIGTVDPAGAKNQAPNVLFGPGTAAGKPDVTKDLGVGVTELDGKLDFTVSNSDRIFLPDSATVSDAGVPEPSSLMLAVIGAAILLGYRGLAPRIRAANGSGV